MTLYFDVSGVLSLASSSLFLLYPAYKACRGHEKPNRSWLWAKLVAMCFQANYSVSMFLEPELRPASAVLFTGCGMQSLFLASMFCVHCRSTGYEDLEEELCP